MYFHVTQRCMNSNRSMPTVTVTDIIRDFFHSFDAVWQKVLNFMKEQKDWQLVRKVGHICYTSILALLHTIFTVGIEKKLFFVILVLGQGYFHTDTLVPLEKMSDHLSYAISI